MIPHLASVCTPAAHSAHSHDECLSPAAILTGIVLTAAIASLEETACPQREYPLTHPPRIPQLPGLHVFQISNAPMHLILMRFRRYFCLSDHSCGLSSGELHQRRRRRWHQGRQWIKRPPVRVRLHSVNACSELKILHANMIQEKELHLKEFFNFQPRKRELATHTGRASNFRERSRRDGMCMCCHRGRNLHVHALSHQSQRM